MDSWIGNYQYKSMRMFDICRSRAAVGIFISSCTKKSENSFFLGNKIVECSSTHRHTHTPDIYLWAIKFNPYGLTLESSVIFIETHKEP